MNIIKKISEDLSITENQTKNTIDLLNDGKTVPFISRYRKEVTGNLDEEYIRNINEKYNYYTNLENYKETVIKSITEQGKLTDKLKKEILETEKMNELEDIYLPFKKRKKTKADKAIEAGLEPLVNKIFLQEINENTPFDEYFCEEYPDKNTVIDGINAIIGQNFAHDIETREKLRDLYIKFGFITSTKKKKFIEEKTKYDTYHDFSQQIKKIQDYRVLALNRGEKEKILNVNLELEDTYVEKLYRKYFSRYEYNNMLIKNGLEYGFKNLLNPSISREIRQLLTEKSDISSINLFQSNLKDLLLTPPLKGKRVLAIDPGFRTGCKVVALDDSGKFLEYNTIFPVPPKNDIAGAERIVLSMIKNHNLNLIVIGNGTASRETQQFVVDLKEKKNLAIKYIFANEAGASVYSASKEAKEEFPTKDVTVRGAISIGRRIQDPLAELVKIDPKSIGVGQYQHDVNQKMLKEKLNETVESVVNQVGVNINTASASLLKYVSGLNPSISKKIVDYRNNNGKFFERKDLIKVKGFGKKAFELSAGFLRILDGKNPLEITGIHPESYDFTKKLLNKIGFTKEDLKNKTKLQEIIKSLNSIDIKKLSEEFNIGEYTLTDIINEIKKPGRDPRDNMPQPILMDNILKFDDLSEGMTLQGKVTNITAFGAFVDLGIKESGLIHKSNMSEKFIKHPSELLNINQIVKVEILSIDKELKRIGLKLLEKTN